MFTLETRYQRRLLVRCGAGQAYALVSDIPSSSKLFPVLKELIHLEDHTYRWNLSSVGIGKFTLNASYVCKYMLDEVKGLVKWKPLSASGVNTRVQGQWRVRAVEDKLVELSFTNKVALQVPLPAATKLLLAPIVQRDLERITGLYLENICSALEQG